MSANRQIKRFIFRRGDKRNRDVIGHLFGWLKQWLWELWERDDIEVIVRPYRQRHTDPQRRTVFMWCGEVAPELTLLTGYRWSGDAVYEVVFKESYMPADEYMLPDGEIKRVPWGLSDKRATKEIVGEAMDKFWYWAVVQHGWDLTDPDPMREVA